MIAAHLTLLDVGYLLIAVGVLVLIIGIFGSKS